MIVPGSNILNVALGVIGAQPFGYKAFVSREVNDIGQDVSVYAYPQLVRGSVQPPPRELFEEYGLDFQKDYLMFYISKGVLDIARDVSGDQIEFNNHTYQVLSKTDWRVIDGWVSFLTVRIEDPAC